MPDEQSSKGPSGLQLPLEIETVGLDDWSNVRFVHLAAFDKLISDVLEGEHVLAVREHLTSPEYTEELQSDNLSAAWFDGQMIGTCGWRPADDSGGSARITSLYVLPLFLRMGVGKALVRDAEARARSAGFSIFSLRATMGALGFFAGLGYEITSYGVAAIGLGRDMPVVFMRRSAIAPQ